MEESLSLDEAIEKILNREISVRQASRQSGYSRDFIRAELNKRYANDKDKLELIKLIMFENREKHPSVEIEQDLLEQTFFKVMNREITLKEAQKILGNIDIQTLKEKFAELVVQTEDLEIPSKYLEFIESQDVSKINFRVMAIKMMRLGLTQSDIASELGISPRTVSREFEKLKYDADTRLYDLLKAYGDMQMKKHKFTCSEFLILDKLLTDYEEHHPHLLVMPEKSKEELAIEKQNYLVSEEAKLKAEGLSQAEIAKRLHVSISTLRRAKVARKYREAIRKKALLEGEKEEK